MVEINSEEIKCLTAMLLRMPESFARKSKLFWLIIIFEVEDVTSGLLPIFITHTLSKWRTSSLFIIWLDYLWISTWKIRYSLYFHLEKCHNKHSNVISVSKKKKKYIHLIIGINRTICQVLLSSLKMAWIICNQIFHFHKG